MAEKKLKGKRKRKGMCLADRPLIEASAAGVDIGAREIYVAVPPDRDEQPVRVFTSFTEDLNRLADWLVQCGIKTVAMESTGVYWIPLYEILDQRGLKPCLVNARHMKNVPGRRTDWHDCQWIQYLHSVGLLRSAFRPDDEVCAVRCLMRHRGELVTMAAQHAQHMQKALTQMNLQIHHVISDITGLTGLAIVDAILSGERDPARLAKLRHYRIQTDEETIRKSLEGNWRREHLFTLRQSREAYGNYQKHIERCDSEIAELLKEIRSKTDPAQKPLPPDGKKRRSRNGRNGSGSTFELRTELYRRFGVDVLQIPGLEHSGLSLLTELGSDLSQFPSTEQFISWLALCPDNDKSGGRWWSSRREVHNRAGQIFRQCAQSLHRSQSQLGGYLRRMKNKLGPRGATMATARKIATIFYAMVTKQVEYDASIWAKLDANREARFEAKLKRQAERRGFVLVPREAIATLQTG
jgi:Transposase IS116/IS110/IS902 family./Transposase.